MTVLLRAQGLSRHFGGLHAVHDVGIEVAQGELVGVIGPNGAGKTTLFNLLSGLDRPDAGQVVYADRDVTAWRPERLAAHGLARTFQHGRVFGNLSVRDNVLVGAHVRLQRVRPWHDLPLLGPAAELCLALLRPAAVRAEEEAFRLEAEALLGLFGDRLLPRCDHPAHTLSYANRRRLEIARALAMHPRLLLLDEPTAGMNETETAEMQQVIADLKTRGITILLIEHKLELIMRLCDHVLVMDDGAAIARGHPSRIRHDPRVIEAYLGAETAAT